MCGHGHFDLSAYESYFQGKLRNHRLSESDLDIRMNGLEELDQN